MEHGKIIIYYKLSLPISEESQLRRPMGAGNAYMPLKAGFAGDAYQPANEMKWQTAQHGGTHMKRDR